MLINEIIGKCPSITWQINITSIFYNNQLILQNSKLIFVFEKRNLSGDKGFQSPKVRKI